MKTADLNRSVLLVRPRAPYLAWAAANGDGVDYPVDHERTAYLVPVYGDATEGEAVLRRHWAAIFEVELEAWCTDESTWPRRRAYAEFLRWFEVEQHSIVIDLAADAPIYEDER